MREFILSTMCGVTVTVALGQEPCALLPVRQVYPTGTPDGMAIGDLNGDGLLDVVTTTWGRAEFEVQFGEPGGGMAPSVRYSGGGGAVALGDLDGDDDLDLVGLGPVDVFLYVNDGAGAFTAGPEIRFSPTGGSHGAAPTGVQVGDVDGDGDLDIVASSRTGYVGVLRNDGRGAFEASEVYRAGLEVMDVELADINGDGRPDMVSVDNGPKDGDGSIVVRLNRGGHHFGRAVSYPAGPGPTNLAVGDLNDDGNIDVIVGDREINALSVLIHDGRKGFRAPVSYPVVEQPENIELADIDGDGDLDVAVAGVLSRRATVLRNAGDGTLGRRIDYGESLSCRALGLVDVDGDGVCDLILGGGRRVSVLLNRGDGRFGGHESYRVGGAPHSVALADLDGDGYKDIIAHDSIVPEIVVYVNRNDGSFEEPTVYPSLFEAAIHSTVTAGDVNGDGHPDVVVAGTNGIGVHLNRGDGTLHSEVAYEAGVSQWSVALGDLDGDGDLDIVTASASTDQAMVFGNQGDGSFELWGGPSAGYWPRQVEIGDVDGDGDFDLIVIGNQRSDVRVLLNQGDGRRFDPPRIYHTSAGWTEAVAVGDLDGDGDLDMVASNRKGGRPDTFMIMTNTGSGEFVVTAQYETAQESGDIAMSDIDGDGRLDVLVVNESQLGVFINDGGLSFKPQQVFEIGGARCWGFAVGDVQGDGRPDIVATDPHISAANVLLNSFGCGTCRADIDGDGTLTFFDFLGFQDLFAAGAAAADFDDDGELGFFDFLAFQDAFAAGCP